MLLNQKNYGTLWNFLAYLKNFNAIANNKSLTCDIKTKSKVFKDFSSNLGESLLEKLPNPSNKYNL